MKRLLTFSMILLMSASLYAEGLSSLTLTDAEIQKLKKYFPTDELTHVVWKGEPISIQLPIGKEKRIIFSDHVTVDVKGALDGEQLRLLNNDKSLYLTALKSFEPTRIYITFEASGKVLLMDIAASDSASNTTQYIDLPKEKNKSESTPLVATATMVNGSKQDDADAVDTMTESENDNVTYVDLIRYAWTEVYAKDRLIKGMPHYPRVPLKTTPFVSDLIYGDKVIAHPEASWSIGNHVVTVVSLQNKYPHDTSIHLHRDLCGDWDAATLYPRANLLPQGNKNGDMTTLILVSRLSFGETIGVCHGNA